MEERVGLLKILSFQSKVLFPFPGILKSCWVKNPKLFLQEFQIVVPGEVLAKEMDLSGAPLRYFIQKILLTG